MNEVLSADLPGLLSEHFRRLHLDSGIAVAMIREHCKASPAGTRGGRV